MIHVPPRVRGLIFDCDGTLADTMPTHWKAWHETFAAYGKTCPHAFLERCMGVPSFEIVRLYNAEFGADLDPRKFSAEKDRRSQAGLPYVGPIVPVVDVVRRCRGRLPMAVASGGVRLNVEMALQAIGLLGWFETILTADDDVPPKPSSAIFIEAARRLRVEPADCQVFEDGEAGLEAARKAGMIVTDVRPYLT